MPRPNDLVPVDALKDILAERGMTQRDLSRRADVLQSTLSHAIRTGATRDRNAQKIARALGLRVEDLADPGRGQGPFPGVGDRADDVGAAIHALTREVAKLVEIHRELAAEKLGYDPLAGKP